MISPSEEIFREWSPPWMLTASIVATALVYIRGFFSIRKTRRAQLPEWRLYAFLLGVFSLWLAVASPLDGFADVLLSAHMVQHLLLMSAVPPLMLLGAPVVPLLRGLPRRFTRVTLGPLFRLHALRTMGRFLTTPVVAWLGMNLTFLLWHAPAAYDFALVHENWHRVEHTCFLATSMLFWYPVIQPWPARAYNLGWTMLLYLLTADFINTALSAFLAFCDRPIYPYYVTEPNPFHIDPVSDQAMGAVIMWVLGSLVFLLPATAVTIRLLQGSGRAARYAPRAS